MTSNDDAYRPTADDLRAAEQRRHAPPPRPQPSGPVHHPQLAAQFGPQQGPGLSRAGQSEPYREPPRPAPRPSPPPVLAAAFGRPAGAGEAFAPPDGARQPARLSVPSPWWKPDAPRDPWRDPESPAYLAGPPDLNGHRPAPEPAEDEDAEEDEEGKGKKKRRRLPARLSLLTWVFLLVAALLVGTAGGAVGFVLAHKYGLDNLFSPDSRLAEATPAIERAPGSEAEIANRVSPAVVTVEVRTGDTGDAGSGVVLNDQGYIVTNNHVVSAAASGKGTVRVIFSDKSAVNARIVGRDPKTDLAVIKVERGGLVVASLGNSDKLQVGDPVLAIGSPLRLAGTVTAGIVSSLHRPVPLQGEGTDTDAVIDAIQTDAPINPGNSGGALVDGTGAVIGINTAIYNPFSTGTGQAGNIGLGFAIPINQARDIAQELIRSGVVKHPTLALNTRSVTQLNGTRDGALVEGVTSGGAGDRAGLQEKDVIIGVDDVVIDGADRLVVTIREHKIGDKVKIKFVRGKDTKTVEATLQSD